MKARHPLSLRLAPEVYQQLEDCAVRLRIKKHTLAQEAIAAALTAIERNGYRMLWPLEFTVGPPSPRPAYPAYQDEIVALEEKGGKFKARPIKPR